MKIQMLITADYASIDQASGKLNILGAFNRIWSKVFPAIHQRMVVVVKLVASDPTERTDDRPLEVTLYDADGLALFQVSGMVRLPIDNRGIRQDADVLLEINGLEFPHAGTYEFVVRVDDEKLGESPIELLQI